MPCDPYCFLKNVGIIFFLWGVHITFIECCWSFISFNKYNENEIEMMAEREREKKIFFLPSIFFVMTMMKEKTDKFDENMESNGSFYF